MFKSSEKKKGIKKDRDEIQGLKWYSVCLSRKLKKLQKTDKETEIETLYL